MVEHTDHDGKQLRLLVVENLSPQTMHLMCDASSRLALPCPRGKPIDATNGSGNVIGNLRGVPLIVVLTFDDSGEAHLAIASFGGDFGDCFCVFPWGVCIMLFDVRFAVGRFMAMSNSRAAG